MSKVLVVAAHPDDEILGCGGTIARRIHDGDDVYVLILGEGITARHSNRNVVDRMELNDLGQKAQDVAKFMKFKNIWLYNFPDNRFDTVPLLDITKSIEEIKTEIGPEIVYTHFCGDLNIDHRITFNAVLTACRPMSEETVKEIYSFETPSCTEWTYNVQNSFKPTVYVDIGNFIEIKKEAAMFYESEMRDGNNPRSIKGLEIAASRHGISVGTSYSEAFELVRKII